MIISNIIGGLGNQMFQHAFGRARTLALGVPLKLDLADFADYDRHRGFELDRVFAGKFAAASTADVADLLGWRRFRISRRILARQFASAWRGPHLVMEPHFNYWPGCTSITDDSYLSGYWQSEKYFAACADAVRADFAFASPLAGQNRELAQRIEGCCAISLHVRRGDYVADPKAREVLGPCDPEYYVAALDWITCRVAAPEFFVFSDDIAWAAANLRLPAPAQFVDHNSGKDSHVDMQLMSLCRHHIIANSSFSWWGAWLNPNPEKIVVAPRRWFADGREVADLCPPGWTRL